MKEKKIIYSREEMFKMNKKKLEERRSNIRRYCFNCL